MVSVCEFSVSGKFALNYCKSEKRHFNKEVNVNNYYGTAFAFLEFAKHCLSHKRIAGVLAWWVPGSRDVVNGLEVLPPMEDNDEEITEAVSLVLKKNAFVDASQIRVSTHNAVVMLDGLVTNETEKRMAEFDAWYVFGVDAVVNQLAVRE